jgi:hypothetical protein
MAVGMDGTQRRDLKLSLVAMPSNDPLIDQIWNHELGRVL